MDQKEFKKIVDGSLKDLVLPRLEKIGTSVEFIREQVANFSTI